MNNTENQSFWEKKKKTICICSTIVFSLVGTSIGYYFLKDKGFSFNNWLSNASTNELNNVYEKMRLEFCKSGIKPSGMTQISHELGERGAKEWFENNPRNLDPNFRWSDANRWD